MAQSFIQQMLPSFLDAFVIVVGIEGERVVLVCRQIEFELDKRNLLIVFNDFGFR